jgi:hypothetical protein
MQLVLIVGRFFVRLVRVVILFVIQSTIAFAMTAIKRLAPDIPGRGLLNLMQLARHLNTDIIVVQIVET